MIVIVGTFVDMVEIVNYKTILFKSPPRLEVDMLSEYYIGFLLHIVLVLTNK